MNFKKLFIIVNLLGACSNIFPLKLSPLKNAPNAPRISYAGAPGSPLPLQPKRLSPISPSSSFSPTSPISPASVASQSSFPESPINRGRFSSLPLPGSPAVSLPSLIRRGTFAPGETTLPGSTTVPASPNLSRPSWSNPKKIASAFSPSFSEPSRRAAWIPGSPKSKSNEALPDQWPDPRASFSAQTTPEPSQSKLQREPGHAIKISEYGKPDQMLLTNPRPLPEEPKREGQATPSAQEQMPGLLTPTIISPNSKRAPAVTLRTESSMSLQGTALRQETGSAASSSVQKSGIIRVEPPVELPKTPSREERSAAQILEPVQRTPQIKVAPESELQKTPVDYAVGERRPTRRQSSFDEELDAQAFGESEGQLATKESETGGAAEAGVFRTIQVRPAQGNGATK